MARCTKPFVLLLLPALSTLPAVAACGDHAASGSSPASAVADAGPVLNGVVELQPGLDVDVASFDSVYLLVRKSTGGPLDFVRKLSAPKFPQAFTISDAHATAAGASLAGNSGPSGSDAAPGAADQTGGYQIVARLDRDGDAAAQLGDVQGVAAEFALPGGPPVRIVLNQILDGGGAAPHAAVTPPRSEPR